MSEEGPRSTQIQRIVIGMDTRIFKGQTSMRDNRRWVITESLVLCRPFKKEYAVFKKTFLSWLTMNTIDGESFQSFTIGGRKLHAYSGRTAAVEMVVMVFPVS
ncbi:hypothetical protein EVAR_5372_1 [Eumeta japonica]|uniref:Uncharacterized protein n=1 Tax=Eumeta variegata TaxID=151549 RepID=A0A4C1TMD9_EUMVA|nr:hypothetical protein EVAR_5372_1 [Eumeta japonica]